MTKEFIDKFRDKLRPNDIVLEEYTIDKCYSDCTLIGYHGTRLYDSELSEIKQFGFKPTDKDLFQHKLENVKNTEYREYLLEKLKKISSTQSEDGSIYLKFGNRDYNGTEAVFLKNWGGETIYNFYDQNGAETEYEKQIGAYFRKNTKPYVAICRVKSSAYCIETLNSYSLCDLEQYGLSDCFQVDQIEIVDIIEMTDVDYNS